jgi:ketosteroid isomerase-like protein
MKKFIFLLAIVVGSASSFAQSKNEKNAETAVAFLIKALESSNKADLENIASEELTYGHSNGLVEDKKGFVEALTNGSSDFENIKISNQTIKVTGNLALVRHRLDAGTLNKGVKGEIHLNVLLVFRKEKGEWKLLARQAARVI